jgi:hypothetical protein
MPTTPVWQSSDVELLAELGALETRLHSTWAQMLSLVAEIDSRRMAGELGYGTTVELVRAIARVPKGEARNRVTAAADVLPGRGLNGAPVAEATGYRCSGSRPCDRRRGRRGDPLGALTHPPHLGNEKRAEVEAERPATRGHWTPGS